MDENKNLFDQVISLSKISLDVTLAQYELIQELIEKLSKYEDVSKYEKIFSSDDPDDSEEKEEIEEVKENAE